MIFRKEEYLILEELKEEDFFKCILNMSGDTKKQLYNDFFKKAAGIVKYNKLKDKIYKKNNF